MGVSVNKNQRCLVIGLDGVPYSLLNDYMREGLLPNMQKILSAGFRLHQMDASIPDVSSTSWTSFMTGVNPGEHGIFGFMDLRPGSYQLFFPNSGDVQAPTMWDMLGQTVNGRSSTLYEKYRARLTKPLRSIVMNIPQTYPAQPLNGILTAGFVCPDLRKGTYPDSAYAYLNSMGYLSDVDSTKAVDRPDAFFRELFLALEKRAEAFEHFLMHEPWDLFIGVITETDRLHHFFFSAARDATNQHNGIFRTFYQKMDEIVGRLFTRFMELTDGKGLFLTLSDHGFTVLKQEVYINAWLRQQGLLSLDLNREYYEQIGPGTQAFAMDPARIYVHLENKYPRGAIKASAKPEIIARIRSALESFSDEKGNAVIKAVHDGSDLYHGRARECAPDLVCLPHDGFDLKGTLKKPEVFGKGHFTGMHTRSDAHCILPGTVQPDERLHIEDLAGIMLDHIASS
jgi:predicted AlkP superfamily phosphohydrolase/phosphomutase